MRNSIKQIVSTEKSDDEIITLQEAKAQCIVDHSLDDDFITDLIEQCRDEIEDICGISIVETERIIIFDWRICQALPYGPVESVDEVLFQASEFDEWETIDSSDYKNTDGLFSSKKCGRHKITYTSGMETVPAGLKKAWLNLIAFRYQNRGDHKTELSEDVMNQILKNKDYSWA